MELAKADEGEEEHLDDAQLELEHVHLGQVDLAFHGLDTLYTHLL